MSVLVIASILTPLENVMKSILDFFHSSVGLSWAWSIVAVTIVVRICLVPLMVRQIHSMQALQRHAPEMKAIQQRYKGDRQKLNEELMKFYKENHINPAASCLPLVAQLPVFFALYLTLKHDHEIKGSWLHIVPSMSAHASAHWSGWLLLVIYAGSQVSSTYFMGTTMDKTQRNIMMVVPIVFITFVSRFPVGLVVYWMTTNLWTVGQGLVTRRLVPRTTPPRLFGRGSQSPASAKPAKGAKAAKAPAAKATDSKSPDSKAPAASAPAPPPKPKPKTAPRRVRRKKGGSRR